MATFTSRLGLRKPVDADDVNVNTDLGVNFDKIDTVISFTTCTSTTRPSTPFTGQGIWETDTGLMLVSNGTLPASGSWDARPFHGVEVCTSTTRPAAKKGLVAWESDTGALLVSNGSAPASASWVPLGRRQCTSSTRPSSPYLYQQIYETDTNLSRMWDGSGWRAQSPRIFDVVCTSNFDLPTTSTDVAGATVTFTTVRPGAVARIRGTFDFELISTGTGYCHGNCYVDGVIAAGNREAIFSGSATMRFPGSQQWLATLDTAGSHTIKLRGHKDVNGGQARFYSTHTSLQVELWD